MRVFVEVRGLQDLVDAATGSPMSVERWRTYVLSLAQPRQPQRRSLREAEGCVLAEQLRPRHPLPPHDSSAMDGYAVRADDVAHAGERPVRLRVVASAPAGAPAGRDVGLGEAVRILTGGMVPEGADAVVPVEDTDAGRETVTVRSPVGRGRHIRRAGEDVAAGAVVAPVGALVGPGLVAAAAAAGRADLLVLPPPRVLVVSTGNELVPPGADMGVGLLPDSNGVSIAAAVRAVGGHVSGVDRSTDVPVRLRSLIAEWADRVDLIVTTGGISAGAENDVVRAAFECTRQLRFAEVAMRPGSPQAAGRIQDRPLLGLPGNPVAAAVSFAVFVRPLLRQLRGLSPLGDWAQAMLGSDVPRSPDRTRFLLGRWSDPIAREVVHPHVRAGSHLASQLADADALLWIPPGVGDAAVGSTVAVLPLQSCW